jgi:hypothetical protein
MLQTVPGSRRLVSSQIGPFKEVFEAHSAGVGAFECKFKFKFEFESPRCTTTSAGDAPCERVAVASRGRESVDGRCAANDATNAAESAACISAASATTPAAHPRALARHEFMVLFGCACVESFAVLAVEAWRVIGDR